jgi:lipid A 3-O-deacylase
MKKFFVLIQVSFLLMPFGLFAQKIDNTASFRDVKSDNYFLFHYDNDYFTATDQFYTQGYAFELVAPIFKKNPINFLFVKLQNSSEKNGISLDHIGFTPTTIKSNEILYSDRPFAAAIFLKSFKIENDTVHKTRIASSLSIGIIGPGAFGYEMQKGIHEWIGDEIPMGWQYQIKNDVVLNYEIAHEKQLFRFKDYFALNSNLTARLGTLNTNASVGLTATLGLINSPFTATSDKNNFQIYLYSQPLANFIGYDASLQGGLFNRSSPYVIPNSDIERITLQNNFGIVMQWKSLFLEYNRVFLTREFETSKAHKWGGFKIGFKL